MFFSAVNVKFRHALEAFTGERPPMLFYNKQFVGNYEDIINASRFKRLDLLLDPPQCPLYHIVIIGNGKAARSVITVSLQVKGLIL